jgi:uncharacterized protein (DUF2062 family)
VIQLTRDAIRRLLDRLLHTHDTPERTARAYAAGVFWGFSPLLGLHTVLGLLTGFLFNLNQVAILLGVYSNLPWTLAPYYTLATLGGAALLGTRIPPGLIGEFRSVLGNFSVSEFRHLLRLLWPLLWSYILGSTIGAIIMSFIAYRVALPFIIAGRRYHEKHRRH